MLYRLYIGTNNKTGKLEDKKAIQLTSRRFNGFTTFKGLGYWQGKPEKSLIIEIETKKEQSVKVLAIELAKKLKQDAIGLAKIGKMQFIS